jgi:hypothetical protein
VLFFLDDLNYRYAALFFAVSILYGVLLSVASIVMSTWPERTSETDMSGSSLVHFDSQKDVAILMLYGILENLGYRQMIVWWRIQGTIDYFRGKRGWDKFERKGFAAPVRRTDAVAPA